MAKASQPTYADYVTNDNRATIYFYKAGSSKYELYAKLHFDSSPDDLKVLKGQFDANRKTYLITHGWFNNFYKTGWMDSVKNLIYKKSKVRKVKPPNVLMLDWSKRAYSIWVNKVTANIRLVAREMNVLLNRMRSELHLNLNFMKFTIIAHSFGGQVAGILGYLIFEQSDGKHRIREIIGLDVADTCFHRELSFPVFNDSLTIKSAYIVKSIHANSDLATTFKQFGNVDILMNDASTQPGCIFRPDAIHNLEICEKLALV